MPEENIFRFPHVERKEPTNKLRLKANIKSLLLEGKHLVFKRFKIRFYLHLAQVCYRKFHFN